MILETTKYKKSLPGVYAMTHVADQRLEDLVRQDRFPCDDFAEVHDHLAVCPICQDRLNEMNEFVAFMRTMPCETEGQIVQRHDTPEGTLFLIVTGSDASVWEARAVGADLNIDRMFLRGDQAKAYLETWFEVEFPGHRCGNRCGSGWQ